MTVAPVQKRLIEFITEYHARHGLPPTRREMMEMLGVASLSTVNYHLDKLEKHGLIRLTPRVDRGITLVSSDTDRTGTTLVPLLGTVSAGQPLDVFMNRDLIPVPTDMLNLRFDNYVLEVRGDSMIDEHICDGDRIVVRSQVVARNGETVVALVDGTAATVKTIFFENGAIRLQPANRDYQPIMVAPPQTLEIQGIVVGVIRYKQAV
jgi:repressor LexA